MGKARIILRPTSILTKKIGFMKKLLGGWDNSKIDSDRIVRNKANPQPVVKEGIPDFLSQSRGVRTSFTTRRQIVLNRHFTEIISDVLANDLKKQLTSMGVTITSIETKSWNKGVTVFYSTNTHFNEDLHIELNSIVGQLRSAITERRLIGRTPHVCFAYDKTIRVERELDRILQDGLSNKDEDERNLTLTARSQLYISKDLGSHEERLISKRFSAPPDMNNTMYGLNYPHLYDEVALKIERGRGESSRIMSSSGLIAHAQPLFRAPREDEDIIDPRKRILGMQRFLVNQKKKSEALSRKRRKAELFARDTYKWDLPDANETIDEHVTEGVEDQWFNSQAP